MPTPELFHGIAVVIDDNPASIQKITQQIEDAGCYVVSLLDLPPEDRTKALRAASFFIVDWKLWEDPRAEDGTLLPMPATFVRDKAGETIDFLKRLRKTRFAPVFIFTNEPIEAITEHLGKHPELGGDSDPSHILVKSKADVEDEGVFQVLSQWLEKAPSAYALKSWERSYDDAKNQLFLDFYTKSVYWPLFLWKVFEDDHLPPAIELRNLIATNLLSRMGPPDLDLSRYLPLLDRLKSDDAAYRATLINVLEGERFLPFDGDAPQTLSPGDLFKRSGSYYINVRADCDCIAHTGPQDCVQLYLLKGSKLTKAQLEKAFNREHGSFNDKDSEVTVFPINGGTPVTFQFKNLVIGCWRDWKARRIGRLLPPFSTRLQQKYAAYLHRPGLPRMPEFLFPLGSPQRDAAAHAAEAGPQPEELAQQNAPRVEATEEDRDPEPASPADQGEGAGANKTGGGD
jgi:hypothetical protein